MLVATVDGVDCLNEHLSFFPLYDELTEVLIRAVFMLFNWLILLLKSLPNSHSDSGGTFLLMVALWLAIDPSYVPS